MKATSLCSSVGIIRGQLLHKQTRESGPCTAAERVEDQEALQALALFRQPAYSVQDMQIMVATDNHRSRYSPTTVGSRSTRTARGTCLPEPVSEKNALKESSP